MFIAIAHTAHAALRRGNTCLSRAVKFRMTLQKPWPFLKKYYPGAPSNRPFKNFKNHRRTKSNEQVHSAGPFKNKAAMGSDIGADILLLGRQRARHEFYTWWANPRRIKLAHFPNAVVQSQVSNQGAWVPFGFSGALALFRFVGVLRSMAREHGLA